MSLRNIRKLYGGNELPPLEDNSDEEYEPLYAKASPSKFKYEGLVVSSHSESEQSTDASEIKNSPEDNLSKKKKKKKKKQRAAKLKGKQSNEELDEIDISLMEVNALLGAPPPAPSVPDADEWFEDPHLILLGVQAKHLNPNNEMLRLFGPEEPGPRSKRGRQPHYSRLLKRAVIVPITDSTNFQKSGLSMSIQRREDGFIYFVFDHSREYQKMHSAFLRFLSQSSRYDNLTISLEEAQRNMHVEAMLQSADSLFRFEAYSAANTLIEQTIAYMQFVAHPSFNLTDPKVRLDYKIPENRPFHVAVMKYLYLLTNRACHRTALELAKLLLNLDSTDPLAVLLIVDTLALRAREHLWLIDSVQYWSLEREAGYLFNIRYSNAMAHYHAAIKNKNKGMSTEMMNADVLLEKAMLAFPGVVLKLLQCMGITPSARLRDCALFAKADDTTSKNLCQLMALYAKLTWSKWREPGVYEWFTKNAERLAENYEEDTRLQEEAKVLANERLNLFQVWPEQIVRHLNIIKPMSNFLVDGAVPHVEVGLSADPVPPRGSRSRYYDREREPEPAAAATAPVGFSLYEFAAALPNLGLPPPHDIQRRVAEYVERNEDRMVQAVLDDPNNALDPAVAEEFELEPDDDDHDELDENAIAMRLMAVAPDLVMSVESLSDALQHLMNAVDARDVAVAEPPGVPTADLPSASAAGATGASASGAVGAFAAGPSGASAAGRSGAFVAGPSNASAVGPSDASTAGSSGASTAGPSGASAAGPSGAFAAGPSGASVAGPSGSFAAGASGASAADPPPGAAALPEPDRSDAA